MVISFISQKQTFLIMDLFKIIGSIEDEIIEDHKCSLDSVITDKAL